MVRGLVRIIDEEVPVLQALAANVPAGGLIVEIGAAWGFSAARMAEACPDDVTVVSIDPWTLAPQKQQPAREQQYFETTAHVREKVRPIRAFSNALDLSIIFKYGDGIDLLFIDGDHSFEAVKEDYLKFSPLIKDDGTIAFHDYHEPRGPGVTRAIDEIVIPSDIWDWSVEFSLWIGRKKSTKTLDTP